MSSKRPRFLLLLLSGVLALSPLGASAQVVSGPPSPIRVERCTIAAGPNQLPAPDAVHPGRLCNVTDGNPPGLYSDNGTAWVPYPTNAAIPTSTTAGLSGVTAIAGTVRTVTDTIRGLWVYYGSQWFSLTFDWVDLRWFTRCNASLSADDSAGAAAAVSALSAGGTLAYPAKTCLIKNWTFSTNSIHVVGAGEGYIGAWGPSIIRPPNGVTSADSTIIVTPVATKDITFSHIAITADAPNGTDYVGTTVRDIGTGTVFDYVLINPGVTGSAHIAFDTAVGAVVCDSKDRGGIFHSKIYGTIAFNCSNMNFRDNYHYGNAIANNPAFSIYAPAANRVPHDILIDGDLMDSFTLPVIKEDTTNGTFRNIAITNSQLNNSFGSGPVIDCTTGGNGCSGNLANIQATFNGGATPTRFLTCTGCGPLQVHELYASGTFSAGTGAGILLVMPGGAIDISGNTGVDVETQGYLASEFHLQGAATQGKWSWRGIPLTTTDANANVALAWTPPGGSAYTIHVVALGQKVNGVTYAVGDAAFYTGLIQQSATLIYPLIHTAAGSTILIDCSGFIKIFAYLVGEVGVTYQWLVDIDIQVR